MTVRRSIAEWFEEGVRCFKKPDGVAAVQAFQQVIEKDPAYRHGDGDNPHFYLGKIAEVESRLDDAVMHYTRALALDPWDEESLIGRGSCLTVLNRPQRAISDFKKVLAIDPSRRRVAVQHLYFAIGENYRKRGDFARSLKWARLALREDPSSQLCRQLVDAARAGSKQPS
jgi:tetratricopeptide (TPR) repeat protein